MMNHGAIAQLARIYGVDHDFALVLIRSGADGFVTAVARANGDILAWDGMYYDRPETVAAKPILEHDFDSWDDGPWKLIAHANAQHLGSDGALHTLLLPTYSPTAAALDLLEAWGDSADRNPAVSGGAILAYVPVTDGAPIEEALSRG